MKTCYNIPSNTNPINNMKNDTETLLAKSLVVVENNIEKIILKVICGREEGIKLGIEPQDRYYTITKGEDNYFIVTKANGTCETLYYCGNNGYLCVSDNIKDFCRKLRRVCSQKFNTKMEWFNRSDAPDNKHFYITRRKYEDVRGKELDAKECTAYAFIMAYAQKHCINDFNAAKLALITDIVNAKEEN